MKTYTRYIYLTAIVCLFSIYVFSQWVSPFSKLLSDEIYTTDSLIYQYIIDTPYSGCKVINRTIEAKNDSFFLSTCTFEGNFGLPCNAYDTLLIAQNLGKGDYTLVHYSHLGSFHIPEDTLCQVLLNDPLSHDTAYYAFTVRSATATGEPEPHGQVSLQPNPATFYVYLRFAAPLRGPFEIHVYDLGGRLQKQLVLPAISEPKLDVSGLASGIYFLRVMDGRGRSETLKFVKLYTYN